MSEINVTPEGQNNQSVPVVNQKSNLIIPLLIGLVLVLTIHTLVFGLILVKQPVSKSELITPQITTVPDQDLPILEAKVSDYLLDENSQQVNYKNDLYEGELTISYNPKPQNIPPLKLVINNFTQFSNAKFYYHGDVIKNTILETKSKNSSQKWHLISAFYEIQNPSNVSKNLVNSQYEASPGEPNTITALVNENQDDLLVIDKRESFSSESEFPYVARINKSDPNYSRSTLPVYNFFHISRDGTHAWTNSFLKTIPIGNSTGGGGDVGITSDTGNKYIIVYFAMPFEIFQEAQPSVDKYNGRPIYKATNQTKTYRGANGNKYIKHYMQAENGFTYLLYQ